jgi:hypothetical protein
MAQLNSFETYVAVPDTSIKLINRREFIHDIFADVLNFYFTGYHLYDVNEQTVPRPNSLAYKARAKNYDHARFNYGSPDKSSDKDDHIPRYFWETPIVRLIRGPNRINPHDPNKNTGLDYFTHEGIRPTMHILNEYYEQYGIKFLDRPHKNGGSVYMIFNMHTFVMPERKPHVAAPVEDAEGAVEGAVEGGGDTAGAADEEHVEEDTAPPGETPAE